MTALRAGGPIDRDGGFNMALETAGDVRELVGLLSSGGGSASPDIDSEAGHEAGSGLPLERFTEALIELVRTEALPSCVEWRAA